MEYRLGEMDDLDNICRLVTLATDTMERQKIYQWDELYPIREDFIADIQKETLYAVIDNSALIAIYVLSRECDEEYHKCRWEFDDETACVIHRLCVLPDVQNRGIGEKILCHIEEQLRNSGFESVRLDVFSENPYAIRLYQKNGFIKRGHVDWRKGLFWFMEKKL